ncbi:hypothetical protein K435DRAFT_842983 [Dendrothele bispora CBS 962.96]|uniref:Uncharacterized protein n=1 Tax=Dendrothele bispora (strain CBS 962.96) TaxID=1314807 RepID=A0A4S8LCV2_DENBC|nr:hypothetical protein K435DRAFT_842983 [Dendrothele bispora CBS 962.96]
MPIIYSYPSSGRSEEDSNQHGRDRMTRRSTSTRSMYVGSSRSGSTSRNGVHLNRRSSSSVVDGRPGPRSDEDPEPTDADDSIFLSDLVRTGEASRLRRRGAMRIDHHQMSRGVGDGPVATSTPQNNGQSGRNAAVTGNLGIGRRISSYRASDSSPSFSSLFNSVSNPIRLDTPSTRVDTDGDGWVTPVPLRRTSVNLTSSRSSSDLPDYEQESYTYSLFCGHEPEPRTEDHVAQEKRWAEEEFMQKQACTEEFEPSPLPILSSSSSSSGSKGKGKATRPTPHAYNGCGALIHLHAAPSSKMGVWMAKSEASDVVVAMDPDYFLDFVSDRRSGSRGRSGSSAMVKVNIVKSACGCVREGVGCAACGNPLGTRYKPCKTAVDSIFSTSRARSRTAPESPGSAGATGAETTTLTNVSDQSRTTGRLDAPHGPAYWRPDSVYSPPHLHSSESSTRNQTPDHPFYIYTFFNGAVTSSPKFSFASAQSNAASATPSRPPTSRNTSNFSVVATSTSSSPTRRPPLDVRRSSRILPGNSSLSSSTSYVVIPPSPTSTVAVTPTAISASASPSPSSGVTAASVSNSDGPAIIPIVTSPVISAANERRNRASTASLASTVTVFSVGDPNIDRDVVEGSEDDNGVLTNELSPAPSSLEGSAVAGSVVVEDGTVSSPDINPEDPTTVVNPILDANVVPAAESEFSDSGATPTPSFSILSPRHAAASEPSDFSFVLGSSADTLRALGERQDDLVTQGRNFSPRHAAASEPFALGSYIDAYRTLGERQNNLVTQGRSFFPRYAAASEPSDFSFVDAFRTLGERQDDLVTQGRNLRQGRPTPRRRTRIGEDEAEEALRQLREYGGFEDGVFTGRLAHTLTEEPEFDPIEEGDQEESADPLSVPNIQSGSVRANGRERPTGLNDESREIGSEGSANVAEVVGTAVESAMSPTYVVTSAVDFLPLEPESETTPMALTDAVVDRTTLNDAAAAADMNTVVTSHLSSTGPSDVQVVVADSVTNISAEPEVPVLVPDTTPFLHQNSLSPVVQNVSRSAGRAEDIVDIDGESEAISNGPTESSVQTAEGLDVGINRADTQHMLALIRRAREQAHERREGMLDLLMGSNTQTAEASAHFNVDGETSSVPSLLPISSARSRPPPTLPSSPSSYSDPSLPRSPLPPTRVTDRISRLTDIIRNARAVTETSRERQREWSAFEEWMARAEDRDQQRLQTSRATEENPQASAGDVPDDEESFEFDSDTESEIEGRIMIRTDPSDWLFMDTLSGPSNQLTEAGTSATHGDEDDGDEDDAWGSTSMPPLQDVSDSDEDDDVGPTPWDDSSDEDGGAGGDNTGVDDDLREEATQSQTGFDPDGELLDYSLEAEVEDSDKQGEADRMRTGVRVPTNIVAGR